MIVIPINSPKYGLKYFFIDGEDYEKIKNYTWNLNGSSKSENFYVRAHYRDNGKPKSILLHRLITNCPRDKFVDHKDHNPLNNCKHNLRICTRSNNGMNMEKPEYARTSVFKGVFFNNKIKRYISQIALDKEKIYLGCFKTEIGAALAYNKKAKELFGEFALLNNIPSDTPEEVREPGSSIYRGVKFVKLRNYYESIITIKGEHCYLGSFKNELEAAMAYNNACDRYRVPERKNIFPEVV